jgi:hypothetical protein
MVRLVYGPFRIFSSIFDVRFGVGAWGLRGVRRVGRCGVGFRGVR